MVIAHNISALNTYKSLGIASGAADKSMEKLSSGYRINRAGDDAAGLSISEKMRSQIRGLNRASRNAQDGISMIQTAEGALNEEHSILQRMREIAVQSASDTNQDLDRSALQNEMAQLTSEINRIGNTTEFNGMKLLDGTKEAKMTGAQEIDVTKAGDVTVSYAQGINTTNGGVQLKDGFKFAASSSEIKFDQLQGADNTNTITITENGDSDGFTVDIKLVEAKGTGSTDGIATSNNKLTVDSEAMVKNKDGSFTYDNHGISFTITAEEAKKAFDTTGAATTVLDLYEGTGSTGAAEIKTAGKTYGTVNDYADNGDTIKVANMKHTAYESTTGDIKRLDYSKVKVEVSTGAATTDASTLTVSFLDADDNAIVVDTISKATTLGESATYFSYNSNGISFDISKASLTAAGSMEVTVDLEDKLKTTKATSGGTLDDKSAYFHVGANADQAISMSFGDMRSESLGLVSKTAGADGFASDKNVTDGISSTAAEYSLNISSRAGANSAIKTIDKAIEKVSNERSKYGAIQNRLEYTINNLNTSAENMQAAESRIRDVDMANEMVEMTKNNILQQAAQAMLVQANQRPQQALQLLQ